MSLLQENEIWCVVPAAGLGKRMKSSVPKQYLPFQESTIIDFTLQRLLSSSFIQNIIVATSSEDVFWPNCVAYSNPLITRVDGGKERADSVLNAINSIQPSLTKRNWVLVHDAARPCIQVEDITKLVEKAVTTEVGALLATPIIDTVKKVLAGKVVETVQRETLWRAFTPQIFRLDVLKQALEQANTKDLVVTDEASAIEQMGLIAAVIEGRSDNIKITSQADLASAELIVKQQMTI